MNPGELVDGHATVEMKHDSPSGPIWLEPGLMSRPPARGRGGLRWLAIVAAVLGLSLVSGTAGGLVVHQFDTTAPVPRARATPAFTSSPAASFAGQPLEVSQIVAKIQPSIVNVHASLQVGQVVRNAAGSGIILTSSGEVITNAHVVNNAKAIAVTLAGESQPRAARVVGLDTAADIALVRINGAGGLPVASLGASSPITVGEDVIAVGYSLDMAGPPSVSRGIVSAVDRSFDTGNGIWTGLIQTDAAISSGNSGGGLVNAYGEVIGITTFVAASSQSTTTENLNFAVPISRAMAIVQQIRASAAG